jgi:hypothetical protein
MEDDSDTEMADYGTDFSDDVDRNFDAKARPQQGPTVEIRSRRSFAGVKLRLYLKPNLMLVNRGWHRLLSRSSSTMKLDLMRTRRGVMRSTASRTFGQTGWSWLRRSTGPSKTA